MQANAQHLLRYRSVSWMYRVCIEMVSKNDNSIEVPTAPRTYRARIKCVSNKKCLDTVSRVVSRKSRYMYDTVRYTSIHFDTFMGKSHPDTWGKGPRPPPAVPHMPRSSATPSRHGVAIPSAAAISPTVAPRRTRAVRGFVSPKCACTTRYSTTCARARARKGGAG